MTSEWKLVTGNIVKKKRRMARNAHLCLHRCCEQMGLMSELQGFEYSNRTDSDKYGQQ